LINGTLSPNADPAPPELTSGGGVMDWLSGLFGGARTLPTLPAEPAGPARDAYAGQSMTMPRADFRPGTDLGGSVPMSAEQADRMREASMELHDATMLAGGPMGAEAGTGAVALASRRTPVNLPPPSRGLINATGAAPGEAAGATKTWGRDLSGKWSGEQPTTFYRATNPGNEQRISTGDPAWDSHLFAADNPDAASPYGASVEKITALPDAKILYQGTAAYNRMARGGATPQAVAAAAREAGYDAVWFERQSDIGTAILNPGKFAREGSEPPGFTTYHGTPHTFPPTERNPLGEFDPMKIGTGEGNQAYGVGAGYTAGAEPTAETYLQNANWSYGRQKAQTIYDNLHNRATERGLDNEGWSKLNAQREFWENVVLGRSPRQLIEDAKANPDQWGQHYLDYVNSLNPDRFRRVGGNMYEVRINADPEQYLQWDKPFNEQPKAVRDLFPTTDDGRVQMPNGERVPPEQARGATLYHGLSEGYGGPAKASEKLQEAGVPGLRYLDSGSRQAGQGTHNYVTFSPSIMTIIRRYGIAGLMAGAGAAANGGQGQQQ
jgi:hypothetical protein